MSLAPISLVVTVTTKGLGLILLQCTIRIFELTDRHLMILGVSIIIGDLPSLELTEIASRGFIPKQIAYRTEDCASPRLSYLVVRLGINAISLLAKRSPYRRRRRRFLGATR